MFFFINAHVGLKLTIVVSTAMCLQPLGSVLPQCHSHLKVRKNHAIQRCMRRSIAGWVRSPDDSLQETMVRIKAKLKYAVTINLMPDWSRQSAKRQFTLAQQIAVNNSWAPLSCAWNLVDLGQNNFEHRPRRRPGQPSLKWDDRSPDFQREILRNSILFAKYCAMLGLDDFVS